MDKHEELEKKDSLLSSWELRNILQEGEVRQIEIYVADGTGWKFSEYWSGSIKFATRKNNNLYFKKRKKSFAIYNWSLSGDKRFIIKK